VTSFFARPAIVAAVLAGLSSAKPVSPQAPPAFPAGVELVRIDVVVVDKDGHPVTGLKAADFEITEGGKRHEIASFEPVVVRSGAKPLAAATEAARVSEPVAPDAEESRYFLIFFDDVHVGQVASEQVRRQLGAFLERETHEGDWLTIVSPLAGLRWTARTAFERRQIPGIIQGLQGQLVRNRFTNPISDFDAMQIVEGRGAAAQPPAVPGPNSTSTRAPSRSAEEIYAVALRRIHQTMGGLTEALQSLVGLRGHKSLLFYSEGFINAPNVPEYDRAIEIARRAHVAIYFIDPRGLRSNLNMAEAPTEFDAGNPLGGPNPLIDQDINGGGSLRLAIATGGRASMSNDVTDLFRQAAAESAAYYLIGFQPSAGEPGERKVKVRVRRGGLKVHSPDRYFVGEMAIARPVPPAVQALGQVADATEIPMRVATLFLDAPSSGETTTTLAVELLPVAGDTAERQLTLLIEAHGPGKGEPVRDTSDVTLPPSHLPGVATRELHLPPGVWQARVVIRDPGTERVGSVLHTFEVPKATGLRLSSPILSDKLEESRVPRARLRLDRRYRRSDALYCEYHVLGATPDPATHQPRVTGSYGIFRGDQSIQDAPASPIEPTDDGEVRRLIGFGLAAFKDGDYTLVLRVTDQVSGESRELSEPFTVVAPVG
jgi:VWFA-related protein